MDKTCPRFDAVFFWFLTAKGVLGTSKSADKVNQTLLFGSSPSGKFPAVLGTL
jgi:hypothetical protein